MSFPNAGKFRLKILDMALATSTNGHLQLSIQTQAVEEFTDQWYDVSGNGILSTDFVNLSGKDGLIKEKVADIAKALGWDGKTFADLNSGQFNGVIVQGDVGPNEYNGKTTYRLNWIQHTDAASGLKKAEPEEVRDLIKKWDKELAGMVRAPKPAAAPPARPVAAVAAKPATPPQRPQPTQRPVAGPPATAESAWAKCVEIWTAQGLTDQAMMSSEWMALMGDAVPGKEEIDMNSADWAAVIKRAPSMLDELSKIR